MISGRTLRANVVEPDIMGICEICQMDLPHGPAYVATDLGADGSEKGRKRADFGGESIAVRSCMLCRPDGAQSPTLPACPLPPIV